VLAHDTGCHDLPADRHNQAANIAFAAGHGTRHRRLWPKRNWIPGTISLNATGGSDLQDLIYMLTLCPVEGK